ncbi:MAG TPA: nitroreductase/quinone reductase family protein [Anaerolineae bacterium]|nr:nitroreductase family deazaflavin-dependent oxidoreductase [Anaerolineae bacterium]HRV93169.1 nitroreductase/quinone reductase family protein [Anaerolineae bacterium]
MASAPLKWVLKVANGLHVALYRMSDGKFANKIANLPILLITTFGRKSGKPHTNPVVYVKDGQDYLVSATNGGSDTDPGWYLNLKTRPEAKIEVGDTAFNVQAVITESEERTRLYEKFKAASNNFVKYEQGTSRVLPVIRLTPTDISQKDP